MTMDFFDSPYYELNKRLLSVIGQWPLQSTRRKRINRIFLVSTLMTIIIPELIKLAEVLGGDLDVVFECVPPLGLHAINCVKWVTCIFNIDKQKELLLIIEADWKSRENKKGVDILRKYAERGRIFTVGYTYYMFMSAVFYVSLPLAPIILDVIMPLNESRPLEPLFNAEYFIDKDKAFIPILIHNIFTTFVSITIVIAFDTLYGAFAQYACCLFTELSEKLQNGARNEDENRNISKEQDGSYHHIVECVKKHQEAIEFCDLMESTYTAYFFFVTGTNISLMSFTGVLTIMTLDDFKLALRYGIYTLGQIMHVFFGCWHGQLLMDHSLKLHESIYRSKWYTMSFRSRKLVTLIMMKTTNPCKLSAGKLLFITLETFSAILKTAMSYFTVLTSLR